MDLRRTLWWPTLSRRRASRPAPSHGTSPLETAHSASQSATAFAVHPVLSGNLPVAAMLGSLAPSKPSFPTKWAAAVFCRRVVAPCLLLFVSILFVCRPGAAQGNVEKHPMELRKKMGKSRYCW